MDNKKLEQKILDLEKRIKVLENTRVIIQPTYQPIPYQPLPNTTPYPYQIPPTYCATC